jgi:hypothetical protein
LLLSFQNIFAYFSNSLQYYKIDSNIILRTELSHVGSFLRDMLHVYPNNTQCVFISIIWQE